MSKFASFWYLTSTILLHNNVSLRGQDSRFGNRTVQAGAASNRSLDLNKRLIFMTPPMQLTSYEWVTCDSARNTLTGRRNHESARSSGLRSLDNGSTA